MTYDADMKSNFGDIRFTDNNGNLLNYTIRSKTDSSSAIFTIMTGGVNTIWMYYKNTGVNTTENISAVYLNPNAIYLFNGSSVDTLGNYNGTDTSMTYNSSGKFYMAGNFDGTNSKIQVNSIASTFQNTSQWTVTAWLMYPNTAGSVAIFGAMKDDTWSSGEGVLAMKLSANKIRNYGGIYPTEYYIEGSAVSNGAWNFLVTARNSSNKYIYKNGVFDTQGSDGNNYGTMASADWGWSSDGNKLQGQVSDGMIYAKALNGNEIAYLYNQKKNGVIFGTEESSLNNITISAISNYNSAVINSFNATVDGKYTVNTTTGSITLPEIINATTHSIIVRSTGFNDSTSNSINNSYTASLTPKSISPIINITYTNTYIGTTINMNCSWTDVGIGNTSVEMFLHKKYKRQCYTPMDKSNNLIS